MKKYLLRIFHVTINYIYSFSENALTLYIKSLQMFKDLTYYFNLLKSIQCKQLYMKKYLLIKIITAL